jgi:hypothetical protein
MSIQKLVLERDDKMTKVTSKPTMPKSWVSSPLTRALCAAGLNSTHKVSKSSGLAWSNIENIATGKTRNPHSATIQKLMAVSGISRQQYGGHTRVVNAMHTPVDKAVVKKATTRMMASKKPDANKTHRMIGDIVITLSIGGDTLTINADQLKRSLLSQ